MLENGLKYLKKERIYCSLAELVKKKNPVTTKASNKTQGSFRKISLKGKVVVITGTISVSRNEFERRLNKVGGKLGKSITGSTDFLIVGIKAGKKKLSDAKEKGIPVISWRDFVSMI